MNTNTIERVLIGFGAVVLLGFAASYVVAPLKEYNDSLRIAAIVGVALYAVYSKTGLLCIKSDPIVARVNIF